MMLAKKQTFNQIKKEWYDTLKKHGFVDIENEKNSFNRMRPNKTKRYKDQEAVREFFLRLDSYLTNTPNINPLHRSVLELYSDGKSLKCISTEVNRSYARIKQIIKQYRVTIISYQN